MDCGQIADKGKRVMPDCPKIVGIFIIPRIVCFHLVNLILQIKLQTGKL